MDELVLLIKLSTGEEIISKVLEDTSGMMILTNPLLITTVESGDNISGEFASYMPFAHNNQVQLIQRPLAVATPNKKTLDSYLRMTKPNVIVTSKSSIIV